MSSILAYFSDQDEAEKGAALLRDSGFAEVQVDRVSPYPELENDRLFNPLSSHFASLSNLTLGAVASGDEGILLAADPSASGMAGGEPPPDRAWLVAAVTDDPGQIEEARRMLRAMGARV